MNFTLTGTPEPPDAAAQCLHEHLGASRPDIIYGTRRDRIRLVGTHASLLLRVRIGVRHVDLPGASECCLALQGGWYRDLSRH